MYTVYLLQSPSNKKYIGVTSQPVEKRWNNGRAYRHNSHLLSAIERYGWCNFKKEIIATNLARSEAEHLERDLIYLYQCCDREHGYNILPGGDISSGHTEETRKRISETVKQLQTEELRRRKSEWSTGGTHSERTRQKLSEVNIGNQNAKGAIRSEDTRRKMSEAQKGRTVSEKTKEKIRQSKSYMSPETRQKMREAKLGKSLSAETRLKMSESHKKKGATNGSNRMA